MDKLIGGFFFLLALPFVLGLLAQALTAALFALLPMILGIAVLVGLVAGCSAGVMLRRRMPWRSGSERDDEFPVPPPDPIHRPRGPRRRED